MNAETVITRSKTTHPPVADLKPAGWLTSLLLFGIPAGLMVFAFYIFRPWLEGRGYSEIISYLAAMCVPMAFLFAAGLIAYHKVEGRPLTWAAFSTRMRFPRLTLGDVLWGIGIFIAGMLLYGVFSQATLALIGSGVLPLPTHLPALANPQAIFSIETLDQSAGGQIQGQWPIIVLFLVTFFFNIAGEELWWRGYILPRQELAFGRFAWLIHGLMWAVFHAFKYWDVFALIPICLLLAYTAQRRKSSLPGLVAHALFNVGGVILIILAVIG